MNRKKVLVVLGSVAVFAAVFFFPRGGSDVEADQNFPRLESIGADAEGPQVATFGGGCFWCTEAVFQQLQGVSKVVSGYSGGQTTNPTYKQISTGTTGHAEVIQVTYDPQVISFADLLEVFWRTHNPTTLNRQGNDIGTQYRSVIFTHNEYQKTLAETYKTRIDEAKVFDKPIVTEIAAYEAFYPAEGYHQDYYNQNGHNPYCWTVIGPKLDKLKKVFKDKLK